MGPGNKNDPENSDHPTWGGGQDPAQPQQPYWGAPPDQQGYGPSGTAQMPSQDSGESPQYGQAPQYGQPQYGGDQYGNQYGGNQYGQPVVGGQPAYSQQPDYSQQYPNAPYGGGGPPYGEPPYGGYGGDGQPPGDGGSKKAVWIIVGVVAFLVLVLGGVFAAVALSGDDNDDPGVATSSTATSDATSTDDTDTDTTTTEATTTTTGESSGSVTYEVTGNVDFIIYTSSDGQETVVDPSVPWSTTVEASDRELMVSAMASDGSDVSCSIKVDGKTVAEDKGALAICVSLDGS